jgi:hypothetical protein
MKKVLLFLFLIIAISILSIWWFGNSEKPIALVPVSEKIIKANPTQPKSVLVTPAAESETNSLDKTDTNGVAAKYKEYLAGKIDKTELAKAMISERNVQNQDFYGRVVDQYGNPVVSATIKGTIMLDGLNATKEEIHETQSDSSGLFQFAGLHGASLGVTTRKQGYEMGARGEGYKSPIGQKSSPYDRATFTMWKLHGAEPMKHIASESRIPFNGTSATFDTVTGKQSPNGDLQITLLRFPLEVGRSGQKFDWSVKIEILHGEIMTEDTPYPYWAPESGYQPFFQFNMSSNNVPWDSKITQNFYIKNSQGQFGRMQMNVYASATPAGIKFDLWINPSGSQNLELDPAKQIQ